MALSARSAARFVLPEGNAPQAALAEGARILPARTLLEVVAHLAGEAPLEPYSGEARCSVGTYADFSEVKGQQQAKRALEVAAAGGHSVLMVGPPGTGKSMLAARFPGILPELSERRSKSPRSTRCRRTVSRRCAGASGPTARRITALLRQRSSAAACCRAREISLAHHGVLFLDELPEFDRDVLEALREPLETGRVSIARAARQAQFPARFQLVAAMNPCPCGHCGDRSGRCRCTPERIARYRGRVSGPLADRIDIKLEVPPRESELVAPVAGEATTSIKQRVEAARRAQLDRQGKPNALLGTRRSTTIARPTAKAISYFVTRSRACFSRHAPITACCALHAPSPILRKSSIGADHIAEAIQYRRLDASF